MHEKSQILPQSALVLGGVRSGKSRFAEQLANAAGKSKIYIATAQIFDDDMAKRVQAHQTRRGPDWQLVEAPIELVAAIKSQDPSTVILVDCLSLWVTNLMLANADLSNEFGGLLDLIASRDRADLILVSNEVGLGGISPNKMAREFADYCGGLHQEIAVLADRVALVAAGLPLWLKG